MLMDLYEEDLAQSLGLAGDLLSPTLPDVFSDELKPTPAGLQLDQPISGNFEGLGPQWLDDQVDLLHLLAENNITLDTVPTDPVPSFPDHVIGQADHVPSAVIDHFPVVAIATGGEKECSGHSTVDLGAIDIGLSVPLDSQQVDLPAVPATMYDGLDLLNQLVDEAAERANVTEGIVAMQHAAVVDDSLDFTLPHTIDFTKLDKMADSIRDYTPMSPLSAEEVESLLSSAPPSPSEVEMMLSSVSSPIIVEPRSSLVHATPYQRPDSSAKEPVAKPKASLAKITERKMRKKQQNKDAATRYRIKKREEAKSFRSVEGDLVARNTELKSTVEQMTQEVNTMKDILGQILRAKGLSLEEVLGKHDFAIVQVM